MTFTVELKDGDKLEEGGTELELFLDCTVLDDLVHQLSFLRTPGEHAHIMTPLWGGHELAENPNRRGNTIIHHLRVSLVD